MFTALRMSWREDNKARLRAVKARGLAEMKEAIQVGTVLIYTWGWEQTNAQWYEVVARNGLGVQLREIASTVVPDGEQAMSGRSYPHPGRYKGEPFRKRIGWNGIHMDHGWAKPHDPKEPVSCSWYG